MEPQTKNPQVALSEELAEKFSGAHTTWVDQARLDVDFKNGAQWTPAEERELKKRRQLPVVVNVVYGAVDQGLALITANAPRFQAVAVEGSDNRIAQMLGDGLQYVWTGSDGNSHLKIAVHDYYVKGRGVLMAYVDPFAAFGMGEVRITSLLPEEVKIDPAAQDRYSRDASSIIIEKQLTVNQFATAYPQYVQLIEQMEKEGNQPPSATQVSMPEDQFYGQEADTSEQERVRLLDRYTKVSVPFVHVFDPNSGYEDILSGEQFQAYVQGPAIVKKQLDGGHQLIVRDSDVELIRSLIAKEGPLRHLTQTDGGAMDVAGDESEDPQAIPGSQYEYVEVTRQFLIEQQALMVHEVPQERILRVFSAGGVLLLETLLPISQYPIIPILNNFQRNPFGISDVRMVRSLQRYINKMRSLIQAHAANSANMKVWYPEGSVDAAAVDEKMNTAGAVAIPYDATMGAVNIMSPPPLPTALYQNEQQARRDIQEVFGIYPFTQGDVSNSPDTFKGTMAMDEFAQRRIRSKKDDIEGALTQLGRVVLEYIQATWTERKVVRLLDPSGGVKEHTFNDSVYDEYGSLAARVNDVTVGKYDIQIMSGSTMPSNRWARFEYYMQLYQSGIIDQVEVLKQTDVADADGVLKRAGEMQRLRQYAAQLEERVKMLEGDLQTAQRESISDRKRVEVEKFKSKLGSVEQRAEAAGVIFKDRLNQEREKARDERKAREQSRKKRNR
jgi:hypothetical protein